MKVDGSDQKDRAVDRPVQSLKDLLNSDYVKSRFMDVMGEKSSSFLASVLNAIQKNPDLAKCENQSLLSAAMVAATLDLPIDSNLGFAAIIPYNTKINVDGNGKKVDWQEAKNKKIKVYERQITLAQFQIMYKGFIQLALRSGQYKTINVSPIYEDEFDSYDIITGDIVIHPVAGGHREHENFDKIIGYVAFFRLTNGFERLEYWPLSKILAHGKRYSKSFDRKNGLWKTNPHAMYAKTVLKNSLQKWGILSVAMQNALATDQGSLKDWRKPVDSENINYIDSVTVTEEGAEADPQEEQQPEDAGTHGDGNQNHEQDNAGDKTNESETTPPPSKPQESAPVTEKNSDTGLFPADEATALEEQYEHERAGGDYPDFTGG